jgi:NAD(P)-dependent dehydrogenase (short-subunit alcohol dehydrogenase family)
MDLKLEGKSVLVTGGSKGCGSFLVTGINARATERRRMKPAEEPHG